MNKIFLLILVICANIISAQNKSVDTKLDEFLIQSGVFEQRKNYLFEYSIKPLKEMLKKTTDSEWKAFESKLSDGELLKLFREPYKKLFSETEIDEITRFYTSETGKKLLSKSEEIEYELNKNLAWIPQKVEKMLEREQFMIEKPNEKKQIPFPLNKESGFYAVLNSDHREDFSKLILEKNPSVLVTDIEHFEKMIDDLGKFILDIQLNAEGSLKFHKLSFENIGKPVAIVINKKLLMAPIINAPISAGRIQISGNFTEDEVNDFVSYLKSTIKDDQSN